MLSVTLLRSYFLIRHLIVTLLQNLSIAAVNFLLLLRIPVLLLLRQYSFFDGVFPTGSVLATGGVFNPSLLLPTSAVVYPRIRVLPAQLWNRIYSSNSFPRFFFFTVSESFSDCIIPSGSASFILALIPVII